MTVSTILYIVGYELNETFRDEYATKYNISPDEASNGDMLDDCEFESFLPNMPKETRIFGIHDHIIQDQTEAYAVIGIVVSKTVLRNVYYYSGIEAPTTHIDIDNIVKQSNQMANYYKSHPELQHYFIKKDPMVIRWTDDCFCCS